MLVSQKLVKDKLSSLKSSESSLVKTREIYGLVFWLQWKPGFTDYESSQSLLGNSEAQVSAARFYVENPKEMDGLMKQVENLALENQGYQVEKENKAFEQIKDSVATFKPFWPSSFMGCW